MAAIQLSKRSLLWVADFMLVEGGIGAASAAKLKVDQQCPKVRRMMDAVTLEWQPACKDLRCCMRVQRGQREAGLKNISSLKNSMVL